MEALEAAHDKTALSLYTTDDGIAAETAEQRTLGHDLGTHAARAGIADHYGLLGEAQCMGYRFGHGTKVYVGSVLMPDLVDIAFRGADDQQRIVYRQWFCQLFQGTTDRMQSHVRGSGRSHRLRDQASHEVLSQPPLFSFVEADCRLPRLDAQVVLMTTVGQGSIGVMCDNTNYSFSHRCFHCS